MLRTTLLISLGWSLITGPAWSRQNPTESPSQVLEASLRVIGHPLSIARAGGLILHAEGTRNPAAERQGRTPFSVDRIPFWETIGWDPAQNRLAREYRYDRYDGTFEWLRDIYEGSEDRKVLVLQDGFAVWLRSPAHGEESRRYERRLPHVLLAELLEQPDKLQRPVDSRGRIAIRGELLDGTAMTVHLDEASLLPVRIEYQSDVQSWGDVRLAWEFRNWRELPQVGQIPGHWIASVAGQPFLEATVTRAETGPEALSGLFQAPEGLELPATPRVLPESPDPSAGAAVREESPGVYTVRNLRGGFHPMFVELGECVLAIDAPAGYRLLEQIPAGDIAPGPNSAWLTERYIDLIRDTLPDTRICWVALTHFHNDHVGGLRAFAAEGAELLVPPIDRLAVRDLLENPHLQAPDRFSRSPRPARIRVVEDRLSLQAGGRTVQILQIGANSHTDQMLAVHLPEERLLFVSDLITPVGLEDFPTPSHAELDRWFVDWLDAAGLDPMRVYSMHGSGMATREHLDKLREMKTRRAVGAVIGDHAVDRTVGKFPQVEPHLAVHPKDPQTLLAGRIVRSPDPDGPWTCGALWSRNGGESWDRFDFDIKQCIDPWALITADGTFLISAIEISRDLPREQRFRMLLFRSKNQGKSWSGPQVLDTGHDHQMLIQEELGDLVLTSTKARRENPDYPRNTVYLARSTDGGRSFSFTSESKVSNLYLNPTGLVQLSDGSLVVSLIDFQRNVDGFNRLGGLQSPRAWALRSTDGGRSFSEPLFISEDCGSGDGFPGYPALAVDATGGAYADRLYHLCVRKDFQGASLAISDDKGDKWSDPRRIDAAPADGAGHVRTPMLAVNRDGVVAAAWYDRRNDPERQCQDLYWTYSIDGGATFQPPKRVSTETSCPAAEGNGQVGRSWPMGGDYGSLAAGPDGTFHVLWADSRSGRFQLRHAALRVE